jgi:hypothetical protein
MYSSQMTEGCIFSIKPSQQQQSNVVALGSVLPIKGIHEKK